MRAQDLSGQTLGKYKLETLLGVGGMGVVYRAYHAELRRAVAVKVIMPELAQDATFVERFNREAQTVARLEHGHIVPIYDYGVEDGMTYVVMRLLTGGTLTERLTQPDGQLPTLRDVACLLGQLGSALDYAHTQGVIHRDIKPSNVMFDAQGSAYLVDFGIARLLAASSAITTSGVVLGTPLFMPPEQWRAEAVTPAADQYALAVMTYLLVTGHVPFSADTPHGLMYQHLSDAPPPPQTYRADIPEDVTLVLQRAMAKAPDERFPTISGFVQTFEQAIPESAEGATNFFTAPIRPTRPADPLLRAETRVSGPQQAAPPRKQSRRWSVLGVLALVVTVIAGVLLWGRGGVGTGAASVREDLPSPALVVVVTLPAGPTDSPAAVMTETSRPPMTPPHTPAEIPTSSSTVRNISPENAVGLAERARLQQDWTWVEGVAWSPDGSLLAVADSRQVWLYPVSDFTAAPRALPHSYWVGINALAWSPDGSLLAFGDSEDAIHLLDVPGGVERALPPGHTDFVNAVVFSPDGALLASAGAGRDRTIRLWDIASGQQVRLLEGHTGSVTGVAWSPDGARLVSGGGDDMRVWDAATGETLLTISDFYYSPACVAWSPDGARLVFGSYEGVFVYDAASGERLYLIPSDGDEISTVAFSPDGALLAYGGQDDTLHILNAQIGRELAALTDHTDSIEAIRWSPDGAQIATSSRDSTVRVWGLPE